MDASKYQIVGGCSGRLPTQPGLHANEGTAFCSVYIAHILNGHNPSRTPYDVGLARHCDGMVHLSMPPTTRFASMSMKLDPCVSLKINQVSIYERVAPSVLEGHSLIMLT